MATTSSVVRRGAAELVAPAMATPYEFKPLSDIDDQEGLRFYRSGIYLYRRCAARDGVDPAAVVRAALAEALVHYYPLAGRIVEASPGRKLLVECTGEGAVFVEAEAEMEVEELGVVTGPPGPRPGGIMLRSDNATRGSVEDTSEYGKSVGVGGKEAWSSRTVYTEEQRWS
uniref:Uncharacterized protein n=1 Tax=Oryza brachyantha TaxID=4533 RepID=J3M444_ORYBR